MSSEVERRKRRLRVQVAHRVQGHEGPKWRRARTSAPPPRRRRSAVHPEPGKGIAEQQLPALSEGQRRRRGRRVRELLVHVAVRALRTQQVQYRREHRRQRRRRRGRRRRGREQRQGHQHSGRRRRRRGRRRESAHQAPLLFSQLPQHVVKLPPEASEEAALSLDDLQLHIGLNLCQHRERAFRVRACARARMRQRAHNGRHGACARDRCAAPVIAPAGTLPTHLPDFLT
mmetsp:Transcript_38641/g.124140  ORF Transcript_38641/g.124140 Transcript_38641/m.124140 type:complete len:230 (+) Transcript_38641:673-1362(+)